MLCALIKESKVIDVKDLSEDEIQSLRDYEMILDVTNISPTPQSGWIWDGATVKPENGQSYNSIKITKLAFRNRFTMAEKVTMQVALAQSPALQAWFEDFKVATFVDLARPDTQAGVYFLEQSQLIGVGRAAIILNTPPTEIEKYRGEL